VIEELLAGALYFTRMPLALGVALGCGLAAGPARDAREAALTAAAFAALLLGMAWAPVPTGASLWPPAVLALLGACATTGWTARGLPLALLLLAAAIGAGLAGGLPFASVAEAAGGAFMGAVVVAALQMVLRGLQARFPASPIAAMGRRIAGAWLLAIGLLMVALAAFPRR